MPRSRYRIMDKEKPHFMTITINNWLPVFTRPQTVEIILNSWKFLQQNNEFELIAYVILENHLHLIARSPDLGWDMQRFKSYTAKEILDYLEVNKATRLLRLLAFFKRAHKTETVYQVWEEGNHPQIIESEAVLIQKVEYIHQNPVKRGYVDLPEHWRYSSARNYMGQEGLIDVVTSW